MFRQLSNKKAQAITGEFTLLILLVIGMVSTISIYFRRAVQARIHETRVYMVNEVAARTSGYNMAGNLHYIYEPYYLASNSVAIKADKIVEKLEGVSGTVSGLYTKSYNESTIIQTEAETLPPKDFELTE